MNNILNRQKLFIISIIGIIVVSLSLTYTYAYQTLVINKTSGLNEDLEVVGGVLDVRFTSSSRINLSNMPLTTNYTTNSYTEFTIDNTNSTENAVYRLKLVDLEYSNALVSEDFRYTIVEGSNIVGEGNFSDLSGTEYILTFNEAANILVDKDDTKTLKLYLWLIQTNENQNNLENTSIKGKIQIDSYFESQAKNMNLSKLKIYGNTTVNTTLPSEYQQVEYIVSSGTQYIDTGVTPSTVDNTVLEYGSKFMRYSADGDNCVGGVRGGYTIKFPNTLSNYIEVQDPYHDNLTEFEISNNVVYDFKSVVSNGNQSYTLNGIEHTYSSSSTHFDFSGLNIYVFALNFDPSPKWFFNGRVYNIYYKENGVYKFNLIPCYRKSDNVIGMYDTVSGTFLTNSGTGSFTKGADVINESTGEKTNNLFDTQSWYNWLRSYTTTDVSKTVVDNTDCIYYRPYGTYNKQWMLGEFEDNTAYTISFRAKGIIGTNSSTGFCFHYTDDTYVCKYVNNTDEWNNYTLTSSSSKTISYIQMGYYYGQGIYIDENSIYLEKNSKPTDYQPYGYKIPVTVATDCGIVDLGSLNWTLEESNVFKTTNIQDNLLSRSSNKGYCSKYTVSSKWVLISYFNDKTIYSHPTLYTYYIKDTSYLTAEAFKQAMSGVYLYYQRSTDKTWVAPTTTNIYLDEHLRKVGDVSDYVDYVTGNVVRNIGVIDSYNGETISTDYVSTTGSLTTGATVYYVLDTPVVETIDNTSSIKYGSLNIETSLQPSKLELSI